MRLSSRRLKVTWFEGAVRTGLPLPPRDWLGSGSPEPNVMRRLLCAYDDDRAGDGRRQGFPFDRNWRKNLQNPLPTDHELVKRSHNNAQFPSIAGHSGLG